MKLILIALIVISCSKENLEKPVEPISMTQTRLVYDRSNKYEKAMAVIHFHRIGEPQIIAQYKALPARQAFCDDVNDTLVTVISKPCPEDCGLK